MWRPAWRPARAQAAPRPPLCLPSRPVPTRLTPPAVPSRQFQVSPACGPVPLSLLALPLPPRAFSVTCHFGCMARGPGDACQAGSLRLQRGEELSAGQLYGPQARQHRQCQPAQRPSIRNRRLQRNDMEGGGAAGAPEGGDSGEGGELGMRSQGSGHAASCRGVLGPWGTCLVAGWGLRAEVGALMKVQGGVELVVRWPGHPGPWAPLGLI